MNDYEKLVDMLKTKNIKNRTLRVLVRTLYVVLSVLAFAYLGIAVVFLFFIAGVIPAGVNDGIRNLRPRGPYYSDYFYDEFYE